MQQHSVITGLTAESGYERSAGIHWGVAGDSAKILKALLVSTHPPWEHEIMSRTIRIMLVDDHEMVLDSLTVLLETYDGISVAGTASSGEEAIQLAAKLRPDVILMDLRMRGMDGIAATRRILEVYPEAAIILLSTSFKHEFNQAAMEAGAAACLVKDLQSPELIEAIYEVASVHTAAD